MPETRQIAIERAISEALEMSLPTFHKQIVDQVLTVLGPMSELQPAMPAAPSPSSEVLDAAITAIQASHSQIDILESLLEGVSKFSGRCALYVTRGAAAVGWRSRGFDDNDAIRSLSVEFDVPLVARAIKNSSAINGSMADFDATFSRQMGEPSDGKIVIAPLIVREKCAAVVYADRQGLGTVDQHAIWSIVRFAGLWLEIAPTRRMEILPAEEPKSLATPAIEVATPAVPALSPSSNGSSNGTAAMATEVATAVIAEPAPTPAKTGSQDPIHQKAKRFAKLLVEEIKLYNQQKVEVGRANRDLYERLRDDIEKSRASYDKRYAATQVADSNYFNKELVRILADNDPSLLGSTFPG